LKADNAVLNQKAQELADELNKTKQLQLTLNKKAKEASAEAKEKTE
jgi:hypothetical protein